MKKLRKILVYILVLILVVLCVAFLGGCTSNKSKTAIKIVEKTLREQDGVDSVKLKVISADKDLMDVEVDVVINGKSISQLGLEASISEFAPSDLFGDAFLFAIRNIDLVDDAGAHYVSDSAVLEFYWDGVLTENMDEENTQFITEIILGEIELGKDLWENYGKPVVEQELNIGMSKSEVKRVWGEPIEIDQTTTSRGTEETWWYKNNGKTVAVNFDVNGKVWLIGD